MPSDRQSLLVRIAQYCSRKRRRTTSSIIGLPAPSEARKILPRPKCHPPRSPEIGCTSEALNFYALNLEAYFLLAFPRVSCERKPIKTPLYATG